MQRWLKVVVVALALLLPTPLIVQAQEIQQMTFNPEARLPESPVYISAILIDGKEIPRGKPVDVPSDWASHFKVVVTNASPKTIVEGTAKIIFFESGENTAASPLLGATSFVGLLPEWTRYGRDGKFRPLAPELSGNPPISVAPNKNLIFDFSSMAPPVLAEAKAKVGKITTVSIGLGSFHFVDRTRWAPGTFALATDKPGEWKHLSSAEFYSMQPIPAP